MQSAFGTPRGTISEFIIPSTFTVIDSTTNIQARVDKQLSYAERYALGYAFRFSEDLSFGISARYREEQITDTQFITVQDSLTYISTRTVSSSANSWNLDLGMLWQFNPRWRLGVVAENLFKLLESEFPEELRSFTLDTKKAIRAGISYMPLKDLLLATDVSTAGGGAVGYEWNIWEDLKLRQGIIFGNTLTPYINAATLGVGWDTKTMCADLAYLHFFRSGDSFKKRLVERLYFAQYSRCRIPSVHERPAAVFCQRRPRPHHGIPCTN